MRVTKFWVAAGALVASHATFAQEFNGGLPAGWTCVGNCGTLGADGDVGLSGLAGSTAYGYVSSAGAPTGNALSISPFDTLGGLTGGGLGQETNGSRLRSNTFAAAAGDSLDFRFNYVSSDGNAQFVEYAWALVRDASDLSVEALLFTGRTNPDGAPVPGFGLPATAAVVNGGSPVSMSGTTGPNWAPLQEYSGDCFDVGCGFTGWITSQYAFASGGNFILEFGALNWADELFHSGLAFDGITIAGVPIVDVDPTPNPVPAIPEPSTYALMLAGLSAVAWMARRRKQA